MPKTFAIVGPESTGKSSLSQALANRLSEPLAKEYAREFLGQTDGKYDQSDLIHICQGQIKNIMTAQSLAKKFLFSDTDPFSIRVWSEIKFNSCSERLKSISQINPDFDYLLCFPDLPYESDYLRESPALEDRQQIFNYFLNELQGKTNFLGIVKGVGEAREISALELIQAKYSSYF